eukprot:jgi/Pico_ML_1/52631/g3309.t1
MPSSDVANHSGRPASAHLALLASQQDLTACVTAADVAMASFLDATRTPTEARTRGPSTSWCTAISSPGAHVARKDAMIDTCVREA